MARSFPQNFDLRLFFGPRAKQFARSEDAFQQLLGDALKGMAGPYAHVSPTRGRDGSIDAFLLDSAPLEGPFENLPLPLIVECKTHDETVKDIERNILGQWAAVKKKLESNASAGWKHLFEPWLEARSYVYCVSAHIQAEQIRSSLKKSIADFFATLPLDQRPPIEAVRVVDWSDLRFWLNSLPQVCDEWLGIELDLILDHATYLNRLSGFREYLLPAKLEFVQPAPDSIFHPERVLQGLEMDKDHGVLLVGGGGVGKTRTSIEVGTHAANAGWRVLHVLPDEPGIETEDLAETVLPYANSRTLLIFDYIDQMQRLDLGGLRRSLIPAANERGIQLGDLRDEEADKVRAIALRWLERHEGTVDIQYVLTVVLHCADLADDEATTVRELALRWLDSHHTTHDAQFIFYALLNRSDLAAGEVTKARELALRWLDLHHDTLEAGFVLPPLLDQREFQGDEAAPLLEKAVKWLEIFYDTTDAEFVLKRLFRRSDVPDAASVPLMRSAIQRLQERLADDEATFLLRSCLQYRIEHDTLPGELVALAIRWLELHPGNANGDYVWNRVLRYRTVSDSDWLKVSGFALLWLKGRKVTDRDFDRTTNSLLKRAHLLEPSDRDLVLKSAVELLGTRLDQQGRRRMVVSLGWQAQLLPDDDPLKHQINEALSAG